MQEKKQNKMSAPKSDPKLWERVKKQITQSDSRGKSGTWNARKAQFAVQKYKSLGGTYLTPKSSKNSLVKWTKESWGYIDDKPGNRYLPLKIRQKLSEQEKATENRLKRSATKKKSTRAKYSKSVSRKMQSLRKKK